MSDILSLKEGKVKIVIFGLVIATIIAVNILGSLSRLPSQKSAMRSTLQFFFSVPGVKWPEPESDAAKVEVATVLPRPLPLSSNKEKVKEIPIGKQSEPLSLDLDRLISNTALQYGIDPLLIKAVISVESGFKTQAVSPKGAMGLMQLMPETAEGLGVVDPFDPIENVRCGAKYLAGLLDEFDGDLRLALAAYNAGPETVRRYQGLPPFEETRRFVSRVMENYFIEKANIAKTFKN